MAAPHQIATDPRPVDKNPKSGGETCPKWVCRYRVALISRRIGCVGVEEPSALKRPSVQLVAAWIALFAYCCGASSSALGLIQCEEPNGRITVELASLDSCCARIASTHQHDDATQCSASCKASSSCPCNDTPLSIEPASPVTKSPLKSFSVSLAGPPHWLPSASAPRGHRLSVRFAKTAPTASCPMRRYLRSVILLV